MFELRPYQVSAIERLREKIRAGRRRLVLVAPTGSGKTVIASSMMQSAVERGSQVVFIAHRKELIDQARDKLKRFGVEAGIVMASRKSDLARQVQICSVQTLVRRMDRLPNAQLVVYDEAHHSLSESARKIVDFYNNAVIIGLTATPWRTDKIGLADMYEDQVVAASPSELIASGALVDYDAYAYDAPDLHQVRVTAGDYNQKDLALACNTQVLVGSVVREYIQHSLGRRAILFPVNIIHSETLVREFQAAGIRARHIDCDTPRAEREAAIAGLNSGEITILSSVGVLTEGFDAPSAEVCIVARPTKSLVLHLQMIGRVLRPSPETGKNRALIHDHAGNLLRHGLPDDERDYSLTATPERVRALHTCPLCFNIFVQLKAGCCPGCGQLIAVPDERESWRDRGDKKTVDGRRISKEDIMNMRERRAGIGLKRDLSDAQLAKAARATRQEKIAEYKRLVLVAERKGFKPGFAAWQYRETFSVWPRFNEDELKDVEPAERPFIPLPSNERKIA